MSLTAVTLANDHPSLCKGLADTFPTPHKGGWTGTVPAEMPTYRPSEHRGAKQFPWVLLTEANRFVWPGRDLRRKGPDGGPETVAFGLLPRAFFKEMASKFADAIERRLTPVVRRTQ